MHVHEEDNDDQPIGHVLSRREILKVLAGAGAAVFVGYGTSRAAASGLLGATPASANAALTDPLNRAINRVYVPSCVARPELTEGPYFVDEHLNRSDIRIDTHTGQARPGVELDLNFLITEINNGCAPYPNVMVDVWHCDALGVYSEFGSGVNHDWLRGYQMTDANGEAHFITVYPGWYQGRTVHIHFKIRTDPNNQQGYDFTSQLFFDDTFTDTIFANNAPYNTRPNRDTRNAQDGIYQQGGSQLLLTCTPNGSGGYTATIDIGLVINGGTPTATPGAATATATGTAVATSTPNATNTAQPTSTSQPTSTNTPNPSATNTPNPSATNTPQPTSTRTNTPQPTGTAQATNTPNPSATNTPNPGATNTPGATSTPVPTATPCTVTYSDVNSGDYFYEAVNYLGCNGVVTGYPDGTFRPYNNASRGQFMKIVVLSQGWTLNNPLVPTFSDVPRGSTFYQYIETAVDHGIIDGYSDGTFRPGENVTRAQVCKIVALARNWTLINPFIATFSDVPRGSTFYQYIETAVQKGVVTGYGNGTFGPGNTAFRGQIAKIVYLSLGTSKKRR